MACNLIFSRLESYFSEVYIKYDIRVYVHDRKPEYHESRWGSQMIFLKSNIEKGSIGINRIGYTLDMEMETNPSSAHIFIEDDSLYQVRVFLWYRY